MIHTVKLFIFTLLFFSFGIIYYWYVRESTMLSPWLGVTHYANETSFRIDWFPSFVHQFSFVIFTWLALERSYMWFSLLFWFVVNTLFELGQALPNEYGNYFPKFMADYFKNGTYSHEDMLALVVATVVAYVVMVKFKKGV